MCWTSRVRNKEVLHRVKEEENVSVTREGCKNCRERYGGEGKRGLVRLAAIFVAFR
jgi:hypothetical protein